MKRLCLLILLIIILTGCNSDKTPDSDYPNPKSGDSSPTVTNEKDKDRDGSVDNTYPSKQDRFEKLSNRQETLNDLLAKIGKLIGTNLQKEIYIDKKNDAKHEKVISFYELKIAKQEAKENEEIKDLLEMAKLIKHKKDHEILGPYFVKESLKDINLLKEFKKDTESRKQKVDEQMCHL